EVRVRRVQRDPRAGLVADAAGESVVVGVDVGDEHAAYVGDRRADDVEAGFERGERILRVPTGVDQIDTRVSLEHVDEYVAQRVVRERDGHAPQAGPHPFDRWERHGDRVGGHSSSRAHSFGPRNWPPRAISIMSERASLRSHSSPSRDAMSTTPRLLVDGLVFVEGPRWRGDRLWFSDMHGEAVHTVDI